MSYLYLHLTTSTILGSANTVSIIAPDVTAAGATTVKTMNATPGTTVRSIAVSTVATTNRQNILLGIFASPTFDKTQFVGKGSIAMYAADRINNLSTGFCVNNVIIYVYDPATSSVVGKVFESLATVTSAIPSDTINTTQVSLFDITPQQRVLAKAGHILVCEVWATFSQATAVSRTGTMYYDGNAAYMSENQVSASQATFLDFTSDELTFGTPAPRITFPTNGGPDYSYGGKTWTWNDTKQVWSRSDRLLNPMIAIGDLLFYGDIGAGVPGVKRLPGGAPGDLLYVAGNSEPAWWSSANFETTVRTIAQEQAALGFTGGDLETAINWKAHAGIARAAVVDLASADANYVPVTGTGTITDLGTVRAGAFRVVMFASTGVLTYNATKMILPGNASITTAAGDVGLFVSEGGGNWRCVVYTKRSGLATIVTTPTIAGISSVSSTATPNNVINAARLLANTSSGIGDLVVQPKSTGSLLANLPDNLVAGGNKRGTQAVDLQLLRTVNDQVASGNYSNIGGGVSGKASGNYSAVLGGWLNTSSGLYSVASGYKASTRGLTGAFAHGVNDASGFAGEMQKMVLPLFLRTSGSATLESLTGDGLTKSAANHYVLQNGGITRVSGVITAKNTTGEYAVWSFTATINRGASAATTVLHATVAPTLEAVSAGASAWTVSVIADTTFGSLDVKFAAPTHYTTAHCILELVENYK